MVSDRVCYPCTLIALVGLFVRRHAVWSSDRTAVQHRRMMRNNQRFPFLHPISCPPESDSAAHRRANKHWTRAPSAMSIARRPMTRRSATTMATLSRIIRPLVQCAGLLCALLFDATRWLRLCLRSPAAAAAETLFLRPPLALSQERQIKPPRATAPVDTVVVRPAGAVLDGWNRTGPHSRGAQPLCKGGTRSAPWQRVA
jgi:hypothetical protein